MNKIQFKTVLSNFEKGEKPCYRAIVQTNGNINLKQLSQNVSAKTGISVEVIKYVSELFLSEVARQLEKGNRVQADDLFTGALSVKGLFDTKTSPWNPAVNSVEPAFTQRGEMSKVFDGLEATNVTEGNRVVIRRVLDTVLKENGKIMCGENVTVYVSGLNIAVDGTQEDEGCWLENPETGVVVATSEFLASTQTTLDVKFATTPAPGKYNLVVASRGGLGPEYGVSTARRLVEVVEV